MKTNDLTPKFIYLFPPDSTMDFLAEVRMGHSTLLNNADILALATPAHEVYRAHPGLGKKIVRKDVG